MREERTIEITEGRDSGKKFLIREKPATEAEKIATFAIMAAIRGGAAIGPEMGMSAFQTLMGLSLASLALMSPQDANYVFDKLMECVSVVNAGGDAEDMPNPRKPLASDFEEIDTIWRLRKEVVDLHTGFFARYDR